MAQISAGPSRGAEVGMKSIFIIATDSISWKSFKKTPRRAR
jgi:hypothetical protein